MTVERLTRQLGILIWELELTSSHSVSDRPPKASSPVSLPSNPASLPTLALEELKVMLEKALVITGH